jgi:hypothetical protein
MSENWEQVFKSMETLWKMQPILTRISKQDFKETDVFDAIDQLWRYWHGPCTQWDAAKLRVSETLRVLFTPPSCTQDELVDSVRFTQASASHRFRHGEHAQLDSRDLVDRLTGNLMQSEEDGMVLDVVRWHGALRSINNRHLGVLREYQDSIRNERHNAVYHDTLA